MNHRQNVPVPTTAEEGDVWYEYTLQIVHCTDPHVTNGTDAAGESQRQVQVAVEESNSTRWVLQLCIHEGSLGIP